MTLVSQPSNSEGINCHLLKDRNSYQILNLCNLLIINYNAKILGKIVKVIVFLIKKFKKCWKSGSKRFNDFSNTEIVFYFLGLFFTRKVLNDFVCLAKFWLLGARVSTTH